MFSKKISTMFFALLLCLAMAVPGGAAEIKSFKNLSFEGSYIDRHPTPTNVFAPFIAEAAKVTNGELSFNYFASNTLFPEKEAFDAASDGRADFCTIRSIVFPGQMNLIGAISLPGLMPNAIVGSLTAQEVIEKFPEASAEFPKNTLPYVTWTSAAYQIHTIKPVRNIDELKGQKIIVWDAVGLEVLKALGANPIRMNPADSYLALSKAMADGVFCPMAPIRSYKITEACKHHIMVNFGVSDFNMMVYKPLWDAMPDAMRDWLKAEGGLKMTLAIGKSLEDGQAADIKWMTEEDGHQIYYLDDATRAPFLKAVEPFADAWVQDCVKRGLPIAPEILQFTRERAAFHTEEMKKGVYGDYTM
jgi:TRAP-type C4-dicarboxylate transport system substrate-binding protein